MDPRKAKFDEITNELNEILTESIKLQKLFANPQVLQELTDLKGEISDLKVNAIFEVQPNAVAGIKQLIDRFDTLELDKNNPALRSRLGQIELEVDRLAKNIASERNQNKSVAQPAQPTESTTKKESRRNEEKEYSTFGKMKDSFQAIKKPVKSAIKQLKESIQDKVDDFRPKSKR